MTVRSPDSRLPGAYWRQFAASGISNLGDGVNFAAMPLLAVSLTDDVRLIAAVSFAGMIPWLLLSLPAGVYIDRWNRRTVMVVADSIRAAVFLAIAALVAVDVFSIWALLSLMCVVGCCEVFFDMSAQAHLPSLVAPEQLQRANGMLYSAEVILNSFVGLPVGAWLFVIASGVPFGINGASFALAAALVATITPHGASTAANPDPTGDPTPARPHFVAELRTGMTWLWGHRSLRTLAILLGVTNMSLMFGESIFVKFAFRYLGVGARGYGILLAAMSVGAIVGGLVGDRIAARLGVSASIIGAYAIFAVADVVRASFPNVVVVTGMSVAVALAGTVWNVITVSYRQRVIPADLFGRVNSAYRFIGTGSIALGALIGGQVAHLVGLRAPFFLGSLVTLVALAWGLPTLVDPSFAGGPAAEATTDVG